RRAPAASPRSPPPTALDTPSPFRHHSPQLLRDGAAQRSPPRVGNSVPEKGAVQRTDRRQERGREQEQVAVLPDPPPVADHHPAPPVAVTVVPERRIPVRRRLPRAIEARDRVAAVGGEPEVVAAALVRTVEGGDVVG